MSQLPQDPNQQLDYEDLAGVRDQIEKDYLNAGGNAHTFMIGEVEKAGQPTGQVGVIVLVDQKLPKAQLAPAEKIPDAVRVQGGAVVPVDIQVAPQPRDLRLMMDIEQQIQLAERAAAQAGIGDWRRCFDCPIPGGVQIAPDGAGYVGTLACAVRYTLKDGTNRIGALTNNHVGVLREEIGLKIGQPTGAAGGKYFGRLAGWQPISFSSNAQNRVDGAIIDTWRDDGPYAPGMHTVKPEQFGLGPINPNPVLLAQQRIGDALKKSGRTTGIQSGKVLGIGSTSHVGYDSGTARYVDQIVVKGDNGDFSGPGDSGSLVLTHDMRPYGLLFAGGGGTTIINPIQFVMEAFGLDFIGM